MKSNVVELIIRFLLRRGGNYWSIQLHIIRLIWTVILQWKYGIYIEYCLLYPLFFYKNSPASEMSKHNNQNMKTVEAEANKNIEPRCKALLTLSSIKKGARPKDVFVACKENDVCNSLNKYNAM